MKTSLFDISLKYKDNDFDITDLLNEMIQNYDTDKNHYNTVLHFLKISQYDINQLLKHVDFIKIPDALMIFKDNLLDLNDKTFKEIISRFHTSHHDINDIYQVILLYLITKKSNYFSNFSLVAEYQSKILSYIDINHLSQLNIENKKLFVFHFPILINFFNHDSELIELTNQTIKNVYPFIDKSNQYTKIIELLLFSDKSENKLNVLHISNYNGLSLKNEFENSEFIATLSILDSSHNIHPKIHELYQDVLDQLFLLDSLYINDLEFLSNLKSFKFDLHAYLDKSTDIKVRYLSTFDVSQEFIYKLFTRENGIPITRFDQDILGVDFGEKELLARLNLCKINLHRFITDNSEILKEFYFFMTGSYFKENKKINKQIKDFVKTIEFIGVNDINSVFHLFHEYMKNQSTNEFHLSETIQID